MKRLIACPVLAMSECVVQLPAQRSLTLVPGCTTVYLPIMAVSASQPLTVTVALPDRRM